MPDKSETNKAEPDRARAYFTDFDSLKEYFDYCDFGPPIEESDPPPSVGTPSVETDRVDPDTPPPAGPATPPPTRY